MHTKGPVICKPHELGTALQIYKRKKWKNGRENSGPSGYKVRPARQLSRALAHQASLYRNRGRKAPIAQAAA